MNKAFVAGSSRVVIVDSSMSTGFSQKGVKKLGKIYRPIGLRVVVDRSIYKQHGS
jgi:hypothetical protein